MSETPRPANSRSLVDAPRQDLVFPGKAASRACTDDEALSESEARYRASFMVGPDAFYWSALSDGRIRELNASFETVFGYTRDEAIGRTELELGLYSDRKDRQSLAEGIRDKGFVRDLVLDGRKKDGTPITVSISASAVPQGDQPFILAVVRDISEHKRTGRELDKYRLNLEAMVARRTKELELLTQLTNVSLEAASVGAWWIDFAEDDTFHALDTTAKMIQLPVSQGRTYRISAWVEIMQRQRLTAPEHAQLVDDALEQFTGTISGKYEKYGVVYPLVLPDQSVRWFDARADVSSRDANGKAQWMTGTLIDVTKLMETEKELMKHKTHLEKLVHQRTEELAQRNRELQSASERFTMATRAAKLGVWDWDIGKDELVWDDAMLGLYGIDPADFGRAYAAWSKQIHPDDIGRVEKAIQEALRGAAEYAPEFRVVWPDGSIHHLQAAAKIFRSENGTPKRMIGVNLDITERKQAQAQREHLEEQLRTSQKMEAVGSLAGGIAHDFNNLLSVILSYTRLVMTEMPEGDQRREDLAEVKTAADRAVALTRQLLAFSRKQMFQPVLLDLNQIAKGMEKMLQRILGEDVKLVVVLAQDLGPTRADPGQIEQVLLNLVVNARDAMLTGGKLTIETSNVEVSEEQAASLVGVKPGAFVALTVTDTGCGIDKQTQARIFEPFFTTKEKDKGTGLGLSTVFGIVKQSGGDIQLLSEPGRGSTFKIFLPRDRTTAVPREITSPRAAEAPRGSETVLLVEDEEALRHAVERILLGEGYTVLSAANGSEALCVCEGHKGRIHLVVTDVIMPGMSGRALADRLAKTLPGTSVLFMSGYTDNALAHQGVLDAGIHFIAKPFAPPDLARKVREVLDGNSAAPLHALASPAQTIGTDAETSQRLSTRELPSSLPPEVAGSLRKALTAARYGLIVKLIESIRSTHPYLASELLTMANEFDYNGMRTLLDQRQEA